MSGRLLNQINVGLEKENHEGEVKMLITYVHDLPDGREEGEFLALDLGMCPVPRIQDLGMSLNRCLCEGYNSLFVSICVCVYQKNGYPSSIACRLYLNNLQVSVQLKLLLYKFSQARVAYVFSLKIRKYNWQTLYIKLKALWLKCSSVNI